MHARKHACTHTHAQFSCPPSSLFLSHHFSSTRCYLQPVTLRLLSLLSSVLLHSAATVVKKKKNKQTYRRNVLFLSASCTKTKLKHLPYLQDAVQSGQDFSLTTFQQHWPSLLSSSGHTLPFSFAPPIPSVWKVLPLAVHLSDCPLPCAFLSHYYVFPSQHSAQSGVIVLAHLPLLIFFLLLSPT